MTDRAFLEKAWGLASLPLVHPSYTDAVRRLLDDGTGGVCPRALAMFELSSEIARMSDGSLQALVAAWTRGQFLAPAPRRTRHDTIPGNPRAMRGAA